MQSKLCKKFLLTERYSLALWFTRADTSEHSVLLFVLMCPFSIFRLRKRPLRKQRKWEKQEKKRWVSWSSAYILRFCYWCILVYLKAFISFFHDWCMQEAQRAREEGERRKRDRGYDRRNHRDRHRDRYRRVSMTMLALIFSFLMIEHTRTHFFLQDFNRQPH